MGTRKKSASAVQPESHRWTIGKTVLSMGLGFSFGWALQKGRVFEPELIRGQFTFSDFGMLKMFLSAVSTSIVAGCLQYWAGGSVRRNFEERRKGGGNNLVLVAGGASLLGVGMAVAGACPGTLYAQMGSGTGVASLQVAAGALFGAVVYGFLDQRVVGTFPTRSKDATTADGALGVSYPAVALPLAATLAATVAVLEHYFPWSSTASVGQLFASPTALATAPAWPPYLAGALIGALQFPANTLICTSLGSSTSFVVFAANALSVVTSRLPRYLQDKTSGAFNNWWQVLYVSSAVGGAYASARLGNTFGTVAGLPLLPSLAGGFLILFGSRVARGCTSGIGISQFSQLKLPAFLAVPCMFGAAIAFSMFRATL
mmetsp:Transcript_5732/g.16262  ORF Transcript_5732/g.16262 Transcript_5732/m.16262 type:complete len:373 (-) Transcript_5732:60-1178(-)|eukprot:CAMPEP_0119128952 /NCGR_PEP_ID=MMETSP1310-20130426/6901_1 /TAXON_ID=464262 /ORGANISM="Genus nov. species nov., Strain RCC2339" /LENGTH=372 /DNA_ID=CAMNT_0007119345 /DNA_START=141 /DNA_END=1259 /DNA_ORIENTATION=+